MSYVGTYGGFSFAREVRILNGVIALRQHVGRRVKMLRQRAGLTQEALGARANLSYKFVGEVERGVANPSLDSLGQLAGALDVDVAAFFQGGAEASRYAALSAGQFAAVRHAKEALEGLLAEGRPGAFRAGKRKK